jgi:cysteine desulfuration protein SufE
MTGPFMTPLREIIENFEFLDDWEDRYRYVIELGKELPPLPEDEKTDANKVQGCVSQVWLIRSVDDGNGAAGDPVIEFRGDSDAHIVRGLVAIVLSAFSRKPASEIPRIDETALFQELGLIEHLTPQRANGLRAMVARIKQDARDVAA